MAMEFYSRKQRITKNLRLPSKLLNFFTIRSKVKVQKEEHRYLKKIHREKRQPSDLMKVSWTVMIVCIG